MDITHLRINSITIICATVNNVTGERPQMYAVLYLYNFWRSWEGKGKSKSIEVVHFNIYACDNGRVQIFGNNFNK
jgi:hypothetical protein